MSSVLQTAERSSHLDPSENVIFQRHLIAYKEAAKIVQGTILEIGSGEGYGILELAKKADKYIAVDKFITDIPEENKNIEFIQMNVPPLNNIKSNSVDFVVSFQVNEHIQNDELFMQEIFRVLKKGGKFILTTPNILMTLSRNPWHIREYNPDQMKEIISTSFSNVKVKGVFGNQKVMTYYNANKISVQKIRRWDILKLEKNLPRFLLQVPYDILNRMNRYKLQDKNANLVQDIKFTDYFIDDVSDECLDFFCIATK